MKALALPLLMFALPAYAGTELWFDVYGGQSTGGNARLDLNQDLMFGPDTVEGASFDPDLKSVAGLRARVDIEHFPVGIGMDLGYARIRQPQADLTLYPISLGVTLPNHLTLAHSARLGSLHPMGMLGVVVASATGDVKVGTIASEIDENCGGSSGRPGLQASLGLSWQPLPRLEVFTEYRYQELRFHLHHSNQWLLATQYLQTRGRIESQAVLLGVSFLLVSEPDLPVSAVPIPEPASDLVPAPVPEAAPAPDSPPAPQPGPTPLPEPAPESPPEPVASAAPAH